MVPSHEVKEGTLSQPLAKSQKSLVRQTQTHATDIGENFKQDKSEAHPPTETYPSAHSANPNRNFNLNGTDSMPEYLPPSFPSITRKSGPPIPPKPRSLATKPEPIHRTFQP